MGLRLETITGPKVNLNWSMSIRAVSITSQSYALTLGYVELESTGRVYERLSLLQKSGTQ